MALDIVSQSAPSKQEVTANLTTFTASNDSECNKSPGFIDSTLCLGRFVGLARTVVLNKVSSRQSRGNDSLLSSLWSARSRRVTTR